MGTPVNKDHDAEYWRQRYESARDALRNILRLTQDEDSPYDDIVHDTEVIAYRELYE